MTYHKEKREILIPYLELYCKYATSSIRAATVCPSLYFSSYSTSIISGSDLEDEFLPLLPLVKNSPFGCQTMFPQFEHRTIWFLAPMNCLLQAGQFPLMTRLFATVPIRRGPANGSTHVAKIKTRKSHPDNANHKKKNVTKLLPKGVSRKSLICLLYLGQFVLKSSAKFRHHRPISNSRSSSRRWRRIELLS